MSMHIALGMLVVLLGGTGVLPGSVEIRIGDDKRAGLEEVRAECELVGRILVRKIELVFHNDGDRAAEGELVCPLAPGERIVSYAMDVGGVRREGVVVPARAAREAYEEIVRRQVDPGILEVDEEKQEFRTRIFPIPKNGNKHVWITTLTVVGDGKVRLWPEGFGRPGTWSLQVLLRGGDVTGKPPGWKLTATKDHGWSGSKKGKHTAMPECALHWTPNDAITYRTTDDDGGSWWCRMGARDTPVPRAKNPTIAVWRDGSCAMTDQATSTLAALLEQFQDGIIQLRIFRRDLSPPEEFSLKGARCDALLNRLQAEHPRGMARPGALPWQSPDADHLILLTDGQFPEGPGPVGRPSRPLHVIDLANGGSEWLRTRAVASGGGWHAAGQLDPLTGRGQTDLPGDLNTPDSKVVHGIHRDIVATAAHTLDPPTSGPLVMETPAAYWLWGQMMNQELIHSGTAQDKITDFNHQHGVMDGSGSWLVLETARDYAHYGFEPPHDEPALRKEWRNVLAQKEATRKAALDRLAERWNNRCDALDKDQPDIADTVLNSVTGKVSFWLQQRQLQDDLSTAEVRPLVKLLAEIESLTEEGIHADEGKKLMHCLQRIDELEMTLRTKLKLVRITVGGKVRQPGQFNRMLGSTIYEAVMAAGGPTPFGAMNRVKLYRNGRVYSYDLRTEAHRNIPIEAHDTIDVPQKNWLGNGGGRRGQKAPFVDPDSQGPSIRIEFPEWNPQRPYIRVLDAIMEQGGDWQGLYRVQRQVHGWRADFYLDCIELFERRKLTEDARRVARELAELDPQSAELLRRTARALRRLGAHEESATLFTRILTMTPKDEVALHDMAMAAMKSGDHPQAARLLWQAVLAGEDTYRQGRQLVYLEELNALLARENLRPKPLGIDPRCVRHVPLDLRVVLEWDAEQCNIDLHVRNPLDTPFPSMNGSASDWYFRSGNVSRGYGPESFCMAHAFPGNYRFQARFYGDWNEPEQSRVTAELEVTRHFGSKNETRERIGIRLNEKDDTEILRLQVIPPEWE